MRYEFQDSLPKLPLPRLEETCDRYLQTVTPLLSDEELDRTKAAVMDFQKGSGLELQRQLEMLVGSTHHSYLSKLIEERLLEERSPLQLYNHPGIILSPIFTTSNLPLARVAATWMYDTLKFYLKVKHRQLDPDLDIYQKGRHPQCMMQYDNLFGTAKIPGIKCDSMRRSTDGEHIVVICRNVFYALQGIKGEDLVTIAQLEQQLDWILEYTPVGEPAVGVLTALNRTKWAVLRSYLASVAPENARSLELLDTALFVVCLDETTPTDREAASRNALHGDGRNRWFDKPLQLIFTPDGQAAIKCEHTVLDCYTIMRFVARVNRDRQEQDELPAVTPTVKCDPPSRLKWNLTQELLDEIAQASAVVDRLIVQSETRILEFKEFGEEFIQKHHLIADSVVQLSIQLAYTRLHSEIPCVGEVAHMRNFQYGRYEVVCVVTPESVKFIRAFTEPTSDQAKYLALKAAAVAHLLQLFACKKGQGIEQHLFALKTLARYQSMVLDIFQDQAFTAVFSKLDVFTTSLVDGMGLDQVCSAPLVSHGYAINYFIGRNRMTFNVTSENQQTGKFIEFLKQSLLELGETMIAMSR